MHYLFNEEITEDSVNNLVDKIESTDKEENINFGEKKQMDLDYILQELKPIDSHKETKCLTLVFPNKIMIFLREWGDNQLMWHLFDNKESVDAGVDEEKEIVRLLKNYLIYRFPAKKE